MFGRTTESSQNDFAAAGVPRHTRTAVAERDRDGESTMLPAGAVGTDQMGPTRYRTPVISRGGIDTDTRPAPVDTEPDTTVQASTREGWAHASALATLALIVGVASVGATLTGLLAPVGFIGGVIAVALGLLALMGVRRPAVTGHGLLGLAVIFGIAAIALSIIAMTHEFSWLSSNTDEVARLNTWLDNHFSWLRHFS